MLSRIRSDIAHALTRELGISYAEIAASAWSIARCGAQDDKKGKFVLPIILYPYRMLRYPGCMIQVRGSCIVPHEVLCLYAQTRVWARTFVRSILRSVKGLDKGQASA